MCSQTGDETGQASRSTVPEPQNWHDLQFLQLRLRDGNDIVLSVLFDEAAATLSLLNEATGRFGPSAANPRPSGAW